MTTLLDDVALRLRIVRLALGYETPAAFADYLRIGRTRYTNWELGANMPAEEVLIRLCELTDLTLDYLYRGRMDALPLDLRVRLQASADGLAAAQAPPRPSQA